MKDTAGYIAQRCATQETSVNTDPLVTWPLSPFQSSGV